MLLCLYIYVYYISTDLSQSSSVLVYIYNPIMSSHPADCNQPLLQYHAIADCCLPIPEKYAFPFRIILKS